VRSIPDGEVEEEVSIIINARRFSSASSITGALWTAKLLNSTHFHREWTRKPHEHKPNA
jgi:hypothetical protein